MALRLRPVEPEDAPRVHALHEATTPQEGGRPWPAWSARWRWMHLDNPWRLDGVPVGIVAEDGDRIVGHLGLTPVPLCRGARTFVGQASEGFLVDPSRQGQGLGRLLAERAWRSRDVPLPVTFTATPASTHLFEKFGALRAPLALSGTRLGVLDARAFAARLASGGGAVGRALRLPGARASARLVAAAAFGVPRGLRRPPRGWRVESLAADSPEIDAVAAAAREPGVLAVAIDTAYLAWRYETAPVHPGGGYALLAFRDAGGDLIAFAAIEERLHPDWRGTLATLMDLVAAPPLPPSDLLATLLAHGRARGWVALRTPYLTTAWDRLCRRTAFVQEKRPPVFTVLGPVAELGDAASWVGETSAYALGMGCRW